MSAALAVAVLVAAAALLLLRPGRRPPGRQAGRGRGAAPRRSRRPRPGREADLGVLVTEVATRLGAGAGVESAWEQTFARAGIGTRVGAGSGATPAHEDGVPVQLLELAARQAERDRLPRVLRPLVRRPPGLGPTTAGALPGAIAACRLTHELGAPLAEVLQRCAEGLTEAGHARAARAVALAGPRATARLLGWLPLLGLLLGAGIGADPVGVLLGGGLGSACLLAGVALMVLGRRWVAALERAAGSAGVPRAPKRRPRGGPRFRGPGGPPFGGPGGPRLGGPGGPRLGRPAPARTRRAVP
ncbi:tight adherence protein B [Georgenia soli]|uniref:Tight adherence protein B n=1 Tax=Georgenia soli TaxID=638953 RepID=A0A2A9EK10_9MICO|nr:hypothetical protein [Georgenia soli]PFG39238.1 tight adherence protein B [Georgenia soli]